MVDRAANTIFGGFTDEPTTPMPGNLPEEDPVKNIAGPDDFLEQGRSLTILQWIDQTRKLFHWFQGYYTILPDGNLYFPFSRGLKKGDSLLDRDGANIKVLTLLDNPGGGQYWTAHYDREFGQIVRPSQGRQQNDYLRIPETAKLPLFLEDPPAPSLSNPYDDEDASVEERLTTFKSGGIAVSILRTENGDIGGREVKAGMPDPNPINFEDSQISGTLFPMKTDIVFRVCGPSHRFVYGLGRLLRYFFRTVGDTDSGITRAYFTKEGPCVRLTQRARIFGLPVTYQVSHTEHRHRILPLLLSAEIKAMVGNSATHVQLDE